MAVNVKMFAPAGFGGSIQTANSGTVFVQSDGTITVSALDVSDMVRLGFQFAVAGHDRALIAGPAILNGTVAVGSVALANGTLTIAAQPDVPRQLAAVVYPGTTSITAGNLALTYVGNDGLTQIDSLSLVCANQASLAVAGLTVTSTKGVEHLTSAVVTALAGGTTPGIQIGTNNFLAVPVPPKFVDFAVTKESTIKGTVTSSSQCLSIAADEAIASVTVVASGALVSPVTAPNGTLSYSVDYNHLSPG